MTLKLITAPAAEPVTLEQAKLHLRVDHSSDDTLITALITAAREGAEHITGRSLITQTWERVLDAFPAVEIELGRPPVASIVSVTYIDGAGTEQTLDAADYTLDSTTPPGWLLPSATLDVWPITDDVANAVRVRFTAGYGADGTAVPSGITAWMLLRIGTLYKMREEIVAGVSVADLPGGYAERLLDPYRIWGV
jgi:uncharacterized phiE125 gp8 family phage protein